MLLFFLYFGIKIFSSDSCEYGKVMIEGVCQCPKLGQVFNDTSKACECDIRTMTNDAYGNCTCKFAEMKLNSNGVCTCQIPGKSFDNISSCVCDKNSMNLINNTCQCKILGKIINPITNLCGCYTSTMLQLPDNTCKCKELGKRIDPLSKSCSCNNLTMTSLPEGTCKCNEILKTISSDTNECICMNNLILSDQGKCTCPKGFEFDQSLNMCSKGLSPWIYSIGDPSIRFDYISSDVKCNSHFIIRAKQDNPKAHGKITYNWTMTPKNSSNLTKEQLSYFSNSYDKNFLKLSTSLLLNIISITFTLEISYSKSESLRSSIEIPFSSNPIDLIIRPSQNIVLTNKPRKILASALKDGCAKIPLKSVLKGINISSSPASNNTAPFELDSMNASLSPTIFKSLSNFEYFYLNPNDLDYNKNYLISILVSNNNVSKIIDIFVLLSNPDIVIDLKDIKTFYSNQEAIKIDASNSKDPAKNGAIFHCKWKNLCDHNHLSGLSEDNCILQGSFQEYIGLVKHSFILFISSDSGSTSFKYFSFYTSSNLSIINKTGNISLKSNDQGLQGILHHNFSSLKGAQFKWNITKMIDYTNPDKIYGNTDIFLQNFYQPSNNSFGWTETKYKPINLSVETYFENNTYEY